jgi:hypothetical protein
VKFYGHRRHTTAVARALPQAVADGRISLSASIVTFADGADPVVLLDKALDAAWPGWREDPLAHTHTFAPRGHKRPDWLFLLQVRAWACRQLGLNPEDT